MEKISILLQLMIENQNVITNVILDEEDNYFFSYNSSVWSIVKANNLVTLTLYVQNNLEVTTLADDINRDEINQVSYISDDFESDNKEKLTKLYTIVKERVYGVNELLDQIISQQVAV